MSSSSDSKINTGLANSLSNVFKLVSVKVFIHSKHDCLCVGIGFIG